jgi:hypothetical protein
MRGRTHAVWKRAPVRQDWSDDAANVAQTMCRVRRTTGRYSPTTRPPASSTPEAARRALNSFGENGSPPSSPGGAVGGCRRVGVICLRFSPDRDDSCRFGNTAAAGVGGRARTDATSRPNSPTVLSSKRIAARRRRRLFSDAGGAAVAAAATFSTASAPGAARAGWIAPRLSLDILPCFLGRAARVGVLRASTNPRARATAPAFLTGVPRGPPAGPSSLTMRAERATGLLRRASTCRELDHRAVATDCCSRIASLIFLIPDPILALPPLALSFVRGGAAATGAWCLEACEALGARVNSSARPSARSGAGAPAGSDIVDCEDTDGTVTTGSHAGRDTGEDRWAAIVSDVALSSRTCAADFPPSLAEVRAARDGEQSAPTAAPARTATSAPAVATRSFPAGRAVTAAAATAASSASFAGTRAASGTVGG